jgi:hypothetical protein
VNASSIWGDFWLLRIRVVAHVMREKRLRHEFVICQVAELPVARAFLLCALSEIEQTVNETGPLPGGHRKFWYLAKCLYDGGLDRPTVEEHLRREKDIAHSPAEREAEIPAILEEFFGESPLEQGSRASDTGGLFQVVSQVEMSRAQGQHLPCR